MNRVAKAVKIFQQTRQALVIYRELNEAVNTAVLDLTPTEYASYTAITQPIAASVVQTTGEA